VAGRTTNPSGAICARATTLDVGWILDEAA
jgi:hypothetical protein